MSHIPQMHRYRIVAQISLILSILNLVLAAPMVVQEIHEARGDEMVVAEDAAATSKNSDELEAASDRPTSPPPSPDAIASPQHSSLSDGSTSSGYPVPDSLVRPPRLSLHPPASPHESASPHPPSPGPPEPPVPGLLHHGLAFPNPSSSGSSTGSPIAAPPWLQELEQVTSESPSSSQSTASGLTTTETPPSSFTTSSHHPSSLASTDSVSGYSDSDSAHSDSDSAHSDESMSTPFASASDGSLSSQYFSASEGPPSSPPENAKFFSDSMKKGFKIVAGVTIISGIIGGIVGSQIKHRDYQDS